MTRSRYPGVAPFEADALSRRLFFGRAREAAELRDMVLAEPLVLVYAQSGMGKSSLLNAALKQDLWERGCLPLIVRVNDREGPLASVRHGLREAIHARRAEAGGEFEHDEAGKASPSLWEYFRTAQFWRGNLLLTPVLILDQFEELFTLHSPDDRAAFVRELADLVRGVGGVPSFAKVVLSLREDYLANLEELASDLPQILQHRFRLEPLDQAGVVAAVRLPAQFNDAAFASSLSSAPFEVTDDAIAGIWSYLSRSAPGRVAKARPSVEPFQLQLVCERVEALARGKPAVTWEDLGGDRGLAHTIASFYERQLASLPPHARSRVRRLCEYGLITRHDRRTSLDEDAILQRFKIDALTLRDLVDRRLLRADSRLGVPFYEISHDTLIAPIVGPRDARERLVRRVKIAAGSVMVATAAFLLIPPSVGAWTAAKRLADTSTWVRVEAIPSFEIMDKEVTNWQFDQFVGTLTDNWITRLRHPLGLPSTMARRQQEPELWSSEELEGRFEDHPAVRVSWHEAEAFCAFVGGHLPSDRDWETAARGGGGDWAYPWSNEPWSNEEEKNRANLVLDDNDHYVGTAPVGSFSAHAGLFDMSGNVAEWTSSYADANLTVVRGGSWASSFEAARLSSRAPVAPYETDRFVGFRCIR